MKNFFEKNWRAIIGVLIISGILFLAAPLAINEAFKHNCGIAFLQVEWNAGDALSFYGAVLSFAGTVALSCVALWQNKRYKELSDEHDRKIDEIAMMPEFYIMNAISKPTEFWVKGKKNLYGKGTRITFDVHTLNYPVINLFAYQYDITKLEKEEPLFTFADDDYGNMMPRITELDSGRTVRYEFDIPNDYPHNSICHMEFRYRDMYGQLYSKKIMFALLKNKSEDKYDIPPVPDQFRAKRLTNNFKL